MKSWDCRLEIFYEKRLFGYRVEKVDICVVLAAKKQCILYDVCRITITGTNYAFRLKQGSRQNIVFNLFFS